MRNRWSALQLGVLCGLLVVLCDLAARPFAETAFMDDWSYKYTAQMFAETGRIVYNGWGAPILGWQIPYGAFFMKCFGETFFAVRISTLPLAFGCVVLFHLCAGRFNIRGFNAVLGSLAFGLSPLVLPLIASFMTDIDALFVLLFCLYSCQRAFAATSSKETIAWLSVAAFSNVAGGTIRQIIWLGALVLVPTAGWLLRARRHVLRVTVLLWVISAGSIELVLQWFKRQPYTIPEYVFPHVEPGVIHHTLKQLLLMTLCLGLVLLPVLIAWTSTVRLLRGMRKYLFWAGVAVGLALFTATYARHGQQILAPWLQAVLDNMGVWPPMELWGTATPTLGLKLRIAISIVVIVAEIAFFAQLGAGNSWRDETVTVGNEVVSWTDMLMLLGPFTVVYMLLLMPRAASGQVFDRYFVCVMPILLLLLIRTYQVQFHKRLPAVAAAVVCIFSLYSVAELHDWFAGLRANIAAVSKLESAGIPRSMIDAGWLANGLAQVELGGYVNNPGIQVPASAFHPIEPVKRSPKCANWFDVMSPAIRERYVFTLSSTPCFRSTSFSPTTYSTWLPPFQYTLFVEEIPNE